MKKILFALLLLVVAVAVVLVARGRRGGDPDALERHGIRGPSEPTPLPVDPPRTSPSAYAEGGENALALWVNDSSASWLGLVHGLKSIGVPVRVLTDADAALRHRVVMAYPSLTGANTPAALRDKLAKHVAQGGTLIAFSVVGGGLRDVIGFGDAVEARGLRAIRLLPSPEEGWRPEPGEAEVSLADAGEASAGLPGVRYEKPRRSAIAVYPDGGAAIIGGPSGAGRAYAIGFDLGHFILRAHNGRFSGRDEAYVNAYQPKIDGLLRLVKRMYVLGERDAVTLHPVPGDRDFAALITHDVDYTGSMNNVEAYSADEAARGIPATYFIQAKYVTDYNDQYFLTYSRKEDLRRLVARGMEVASHSVAHSNVFSKMPLGSGREAYPGYRPFVRTFETQEGGTILGELRVSKYLLETLSGASILSFRPGHLSLPPALPQALAAAGYKYGSSITAGQALTHLPYRAMHGRSYDAESETYEFPVTLEDEAWNLGENVDSGIAVARAIGRHGGLVNVLIHTDTLGGKLEFERRFHAALKNEAWFGTVSSFGAWWAARDRVTLRVDATVPGSRALKVRAERAIGGLTLEVPASWRLEPEPGVAQAGRRVVIDTIRAGSTAALRFSL